jgi:hypothetical protein
MTKPQIMWWDNPFDFEQRIMPEPNSGCWIWVGAVTGVGYGQWKPYTGAKRLMAHRVAYELFRGPIPDGFVLDHICRFPLCVNPFHLEIVTQQINTLRGIGPTSKNAKKTQCPKGHPLDGDNLYMTPDGRRNCKQCRYESVRRYQCHS